MRLEMFDWLGYWSIMRLEATATALRPGQSFTTCIARDGPFWIGSTSAAEERYMSADKTKKFFDHAVVNYNCGDVRALLDAKLDKAGPLLCCVVNGIDLVGGMMLGFNCASQKRSVEFMTRYMNVSLELAQLIYVLVRCGVAHEGTTKLAVHYFVYPARLSPNIFLYRDKYGAIWLNVTEMANLYLEAISEIEKEVTVHLRHIPNVIAREENVFARALGQIGTDIVDFCQLAAKDRNAPERERLERGEIEHMSSASPFLAERLTHFTVPKT